MRSILLLTALTFFSISGDASADSFRATCHVISENSDFVRANCRTRNGSWAYTELFVANCMGDIANDDGRLVCPRHPNYLPPGSYIRSCQGCSVQRSLLICTCASQSGQWLSTNLELISCTMPLWNAGISNVNGDLRCN